MSIAERLHILRAEIRDLAHQSGRSPNDVRLIAVSKTHPAAAITAALSAGQIAFGENKVQEALEKIEALTNPRPEWHLIGHLQRNKVRFCPKNFDWVHSIDSTALLERLEQRCAQEQTHLNILLQANLSEEPSKSGFSNWDQLREAAAVANHCQWLRWRGLMTMAAARATEKVSRNIFATLRTWLERLQQDFPDAQLTELSMGMSGDYRAAIAEGATMVRIGSAIFGERDDGIA